MTTAIACFLRRCAVLLALLLAAPLVLAQNNAAFVSQSVPATMVAGQKYNVSVTVFNNGTTSWSAVGDFKLGSQNPANNQTWGLSRVPVTTNVARGKDNYTFLFEVTAPSLPGTYDFQWRMIQGTSGWFGAPTTNVAVTVVGPPTISASLTPSPMVAGKAFTLAWNTTGATSVVRSCTASGTGYSGNDTMPAVNGTFNGTASAAWVGYPSTCTWTATGLGGSATFTQTMTTSAAPPTITVSRTPSPMVAGQGFTLAWNTANATSVARSCTAAGTGFSGSATMPTASGTSTGTASAAWVGYPSTCTWTATGPGGTATFTETMTTVAPPTISVSRTPSPMTAGQGYTLTWNSANATSVTRSCTASGTGFSGTTTMPTPSGTSSGTADAAWVGSPSTCTWTATGSGGSATFTETMTTSSAAPTLSVSRTPAPMVPGQGYTLTWNSTNATSVTRSCTAGGTGFSGSSTMPTVSGTSTGTADPAWAGYPSTCTWTATGNAGTATFTETMTTSAPATISVSRTPSPMVAGQGYTLTWNSTNASSVTRSCTSTGTGFAGTSTLAASGTSTGTADAAWVGHPSTCTWTTTGAGGTATFTETMTTAAAAPTISVSRTPSPMVAGQGYTLTWSSTSATSVTRSCTASGTGFAGSATLPTASGTSTGTADPAWVGHPSTCTWTATGSGGTATFTETMTTSPTPPTISVSRTPATMVAGQGYTLTWNSTNATAVARSCTAGGTGFSGSASMPTVSGTSTGTADPAWVGYPSTCTWTATGDGGSVTYIETMRTSAPATISVSRTPSPMVAGQGYTLTWSSTNASSVSRSCTASGTGFSGHAAFAASGTSNATAEAAWVGYPSTCTWTATGSGGSATFTETMTTSPAPPTIGVARTPSPMVAGQNYTLTWNTTGATSVARSCTAGGTGFSGSATMPSVSGTSTGSADTLWVGHPSTCTWTATGAGGSATFTETMTTAAAPPTISVSRTPSPMVVGQGYTLTWNSTDASSVTRSCTAGGTGFSGNSTMPAASGTSTGTAQAGWAGYPSTCTWTATGAGGTATFTETMTTAPVPTVSVTRTPSPMAAGQSYTLMWNTTNATSVTRSCTAGGTGFNGSATMATVSGTSTGTADPAWAGYPSTCTWTATGNGGSATFTETMTTSAALPTISASRAPTPMVAGQGYTLAWSSSNATSVTRSCTANGTGYNGSTAMPAVSGSSTGTADPLWVGYPSTCTWTATGAGGSATFTETMTTSALATITVARTPSPMVAGQNYTLTWSSTNATAVSRSCTSTGTGYTDNSALAVSGTSTGTASTGWVAYPSTCTWTASGNGGTATYTETMTTSAAPDPVTYFHNDVSGTPQLATDASGNVLWKESYQPYGNKLANPAAGSGNKLGYAGKPYDNNSGLSYMGARYYDPMLGRFMGVDPKGADPEDIHSFNRYAYANNNPYKFLDPDGHSPVLAVPAAILTVGGGIVYATSSPAQQRQMRESLNRLARKTDEVVDKLRGLVFNESAKGENRTEPNGSAPSLPGTLVGDQSDPKAGPNQSGTRHTSGPLKPEHGGTGDFQTDLDKLTGGARPWQPGDKAPPGSLVGPNGIFGRPGNSSGGKSIDIPANGSRPHETLHYP